MDAETGGVSGVFFLQRLKCSPGKPEVSPISLRYPGNNVEDREGEATRVERRRESERRGKKEKKNP